MMNWQIGNLLKCGRAMVGEKIERFGLRLKQGWVWLGYGAMGMIGAFPQPRPDHASVESQVTDSQ